MTDTTQTITDALKAKISGIQGISYDLNDPDIMKREFVADIGFDSLDMISFYFELEEEFSVSIGEEDIDSGRVATFGGMVEHIERTSGKS